MARTRDLSYEELFILSYPTPRDLHRLAQEKDRQKRSRFLYKLFKPRWPEVEAYDESKLLEDASKRYEKLLVTMRERSCQDQRSGRVWQVIAQIEQLARREPPFSGKAHAIFMEAVDLRKIATEASVPTGVDLSPDTLDASDVQRVQAAFSLVIGKVRKHVVGKDRDVALRWICEGLIAVNCGAFAIAVMDEFIRDGFERLLVLATLAEEARKRLHRDQLENALDRMNEMVNASMKSVVSKKSHFSLAWVGWQFAWGGRFKDAIGFARIAKGLDGALFFVTLSRATYMKEFLARTPHRDEIFDFQL